MKKNIFRLILILILCGVSNAVMADKLNKVDVVLRCNGLTMECEILNAQNHTLRVIKGDFNHKMKEDLVLPCKVEHNGIEYYIEEFGEESFRIGNKAAAAKVKYKNIIFSEGIKVIGKQSFQGHLGVEKIVFPQSLQKIEHGAFFMTAVRMVELTHIAAGLVSKC